MVTDSVPLPGIGLFIFACLQCLVLCAAISEMYPFLPRLSSLLAYTSSQYSLIILFISVAWVIKLSHFWFYYLNLFSFFFLS